MSPSTFVTFLRAKCSDVLDVVPFDMTKKNILLIIFALSLAGVSIYLNRGRFASQPLSIGSRSIQRPTPMRRGINDPAKPLVFLMNRRERLTAVKVVLVSEIQTNTHPHPVWELVSNSNSVPTKEFTYGANIRGMHPSVQGAAAAPLQPGVQYRVCVEAGSSKAEHDFTPVPRTP